MCAMPSKLWILVKWIDESSNVISFYGVVKVDTHLLKKTGLHPGQITLLRVNKNVRRAKILRISESKDDVADQKRILENKEDQMVDLVKLLTSIVGQQNAEREAFQKNKDRHDRLQKQLSYLKKLLKLKQQMKKKELDKRNDSNDSSSDSEASVKKDDTELGNSSKCTSKPTRSTFKAKKLSHRRSANNSTPHPSTSAQEDINDTPQYKHQQSNTKQTLGTLKENNLSHQSANSGTPIPSTSAQEDINDTPQYKHQQSNTKQTRSTFKAKKLKHRRSANNGTLLPSTSTKEDINDSPQYKHQQSTRKQTRGTLKENNLRHRSDNSSTPPSSSAQEDIEYTPKYKHKKSTCKQKRHQQSNSKHTPATLKENNLIHQSDNSRLPIPNISTQEEIDDAPQYKDQQSTRKLTRGMLKEINLSHRSDKSRSLLPGTSVQEEIHDTPQYKHQQSTKKQTRGTLKEKKLRHRSDNSSTPSSTSATEDIEYTPKCKHKKSTSKQKRDTSKEKNISTNSIISLPSTSAQVDPNNTLQYEHQQLTKQQLTKQQLTKQQLTKQQLTKQLTQNLLKTKNLSVLVETLKSSCNNNFQAKNVLVPVSSLDYLNSQLHRVRQNFNKLLPLADISKWEDIPSMSELEPDTEAPNSEQNVGETEPNNKDNEKVRVEKVTDNNSIEVGVEETMDTNDNEKVDAEEVIQNNYNEKVSAEEVNKENEEGGAEWVIPNKDNKAVGVEEVIKIDDDPEFDAEEVTENNDNGEVNAEEIIENEEVGAEEVIENSDNEEFDEENEIENNYNEEVGAEEVKENNYIYNGEEQQASISTVNEQISKPATLQVRRMSAQTTNNIIINMIPIGYGNTKVPEKVLRDIDWRSYTQATRKLLKAVFPQSVLATHSLTGKPSPAFVGKPAKEILDPTHVEDIVYTVTRNCGVTKKMVRSCITLKCTEEARGLRNRMQSKIARKSQDEDDENMSPYGSSSED